MKMYSAFIISTKPINLSNISDDQELEHLIVQEFEIEEDIKLIGHKCREWVVEKSAPENCGGDKSTYHASGSSVPEAIADWFKKVFRGLAYRPVYFDRKI